MKRNLWNCDRCHVEFEYSDEWGEQPINYVARGGPPRKADLCECCSAKLERFLAGAELERQPDELVGVVRGENSEAPAGSESRVDDSEDYGEDTRSSAEIAAIVERSLLDLQESTKTSGSSGAPGFSWEAMGVPPNVR